MPIPSSRVSKATLWRTYFVALLILTGTITASHFLTDWVVRMQEQHASVINISGHQRMLSQRITGLIVKANLEAQIKNELRQEDIEHIIASINRMQGSHDKLMGRTTFDRRPTMSDGIQALYFGGERGLAERVDEFLEQARLLVAQIVVHEEIDHEVIDSFSDDGFGGLLGELDAAISQYQRDAESILAQLRTLNVALWVATLVIIFLELFFIFRPLTRRIDSAQDALEAVARTDPLTGCWNRRALMQAGETMWSLARRQERPLSTIICDIDKFKGINDAYGHGIGDEAIKFFAQVCLDALRQYDVLGRFGGAEFVLILPDTKEEDAAQVAERIRAGFESKTIEAEGVSFQMTASFGVAALSHQDDMLHAIIDRAERALYVAKGSGRNRVEIWNQEFAAANS